MSVMIQLWLTFVVCTISSAMGMCLAIKQKKINREKLAHIGIWIFLGFASFLLVLMVNAVGIDWGYLDEILIGISYSYFMADASIFDTH
jgi:hypothetical protein